MCYLSLYRYKCFSFNITIFHFQNVTLNFRLFPFIYKSWRHWAVILQLPGDALHVYTSLKAAAVSKWEHIKLRFAKMWRILSFLWNVPAILYLLYNFKHLFKINNKKWNTSRLFLGWNIFKITGHFRINLTNTEETFLYTNTILNVPKWLGYVTR